MKEDLPAIIFQDSAKKEGISFKLSGLCMCSFLFFLFFTQFFPLSQADSRESLKYPSPPMKKKPSIFYALEDLWTKELHSRLTYSPVIAQNQVIVLQASGKLESFALENGQLHWEQGPFPDCALLGVGEQAILIKSGSELVSFNASNGEILWTTSLPFHLRDWSRMDSNSFALLMDHALYRLDISDGSIAEIGPIFLPLKTSSPFAYDGKRYLAIIQGSKYLLLYDMKRKKVRWSFQSGTKITQSPVLNDKILYILSEDHFIYALKLKNGHQKYRKKMENKLKYSAALSEAALILSPFASRDLYLVEMSSGASQAIFSLDSERYHFVNSPSFAEEYLAATYADFFSESSFLIVFSVEKKQGEDK